MKTKTILQLHWYHLGFSFKTDCCRCVDGFPVASGAVVIGVCLRIVK